MADLMGQEDTRVTCEEYLRHVKNHFAYVEAGPEMALLRVGTDHGAEYYLWSGLTLRENYVFAYVEDADNLSIELFMVREDGDPASVAPRILVDYDERGKK